MPDQIAHLVFARRVLAQADSYVRSRVNGEAPAFRVGSFGPDPLFNDPSPRRRAEGFEMHRRPGREALERLRIAVKERLPFSADFAAGFFCHYALDRICHPEIKAMAARGEIQHVPLEAAYDRRLYLRGEGDMPRRIILSPGALETAAQPYRRITPARLRADVEIYWQIRRLLILGGGTGLSKLTGRLNPVWDGLIPHRDPSPALQRCMDRLERLMEDSVSIAAHQLNLYFEAIDKNLPLNSWMDADFSGFQTVSSLTFHIRTV